MRVEGKPELVNYNENQWYDEHDAAKLVGRATYIDFFKCACAKDAGAGYWLIQKLSRAFFFPYRPSFWQRFHRHAKFQFPLRVLRLILKKRSSNFFPVKNGIEFRTYVPILAKILRVSVFKTRHNVKGPGGVVLLLSRSAWGLSSNLLSSTYLLSEGRVFCNCMIVMYLSTLSSLEFRLL